jgi:ubiquinone/menaquinone biosynthesis C-methylase UbiE
MEKRQNKNDSLGPLRSTKEGEPVRTIDMAGGTGDITFRILEKAKNEGVNSNSQTLTH